MILWLSLRLNLWRHLLRGKVAPSLHWVWVNSYLILNMRRAPEMSTLFDFQRLPSFFRSFFQIFIKKFQQIFRKIKRRTGHDYNLKCFGAIRRLNSGIFCDFGAELTKLESEKLRLWSIKNHLKWYKTRTNYQGRENRKFILRFLRGRLGRGQDPKIYCMSLK